MSLITNLESKFKGYKSKLLKPLILIAAIASSNYAAYKIGESIEELKHIDLIINNETLTEENEACISLLNNTNNELNTCGVYLSKLDQFNDFLLNETFDKSTRLLASTRYNDLNNIDIEDLKGSMLSILYKEAKVCDYNLSICKSDRKECVESLDKMFLVSYK